MRNWAKCSGNSKLYIESAWDSKSNQKVFSKEKLKILRCSKISDKGLSGLSGELRGVKSLQKVFLDFLE